MTTTPPGPEGEWQRQEPPPPPPPPPLPPPSLPAQYSAPAPSGPTTNGFAIAALVLGIVGGFMCIGWILALVFGYIARNQIDASDGRQGGRGMAVAGIVLGWVWFGLIAAYFVILIVASIASAGS